MDKLSRRQNETDLAYHKRLVYGKLVDGTLTDEDYSELSPYVYGKEYSSDVARRMMYGSRRTLELLDAAAENTITSNDIINELDIKKIEFQKERQKFFDQRTAFMKTIRDCSRKEEMYELLQKAITSGNLPQLNYYHTSIEASDNDLLVSLNDIHYGANVQNYWNTYNSDVCRNMMHRYLDRIIAIQKTHASENCIVWANGDEISGNIHQSIAVTNRENVIEQITGVSELIAGFLAALSSHFNKVVFVSVAGNHSRIDPNKEKTLISERLDDLVEWYLAARLQNFENIVIGSGEKVDCTMYLLDVRGKTYCGVHGDFDGSPTKVQALQTMAGRPIYAVLSGHMHHSMIDEVQGIKLVMAGSFLGMDDFCVQKRIYGRPEQTVLVCDKTGVLCAYMVPLGN